MNDGIDGRRACYLAYRRPLNALYLVNDTGDRHESCAQSEIAFNPAFGGRGYSTRRGQHNYAMLKCFCNTSATVPFKRAIPSS